MVRVSMRDVDFIDRIDLSTRPPKVRENTKPHAQSPVPEQDPGTHSLRSQNRSACAEESECRHGRSNAKSTIWIYAEAISPDIIENILKVIRSPCVEAGLTL